MLPVLLLACMLVLDDVRAPADPLNVSTYPLVLHEPAMDHVKVTKDLAFAKHGDVTLACDVYRPESASAKDALPAVVFVNGVGDFGDAPLKEWRIYQEWARAVAGRGLAGVTMNARRDHEADDLAALLAHLKTKGAPLGVDGARVALWSCSANVRVGLPFSMQRAGPEVRAAVIYYGYEQVERIHPTLPVLHVCAGRDFPQMIAGVHALWSRALEANAPWTMIHAPDMPHAFDAVDPGSESVRIVSATLDFLGAQLRRPDDESDRIARLPPAQRVVWHRYAQDARNATAPLRELHEERPDDPIVAEMLGLNLIESGQIQPGLQLLRPLTARPDAEPSVLASVGMALIQRPAPAERAEGAALVERAIAAGFEDSRLHGALAHAALLAGDADGGIRHYERAFAIGIPDGANTRGIAAYNLACGYARKGRIDDAFTRLDEAAAQGFGTRAAWESDTDLASLKADPRWKAVIAKLAR